MGIRYYKPTSPGRRGASVSDFAELTPGAKPEKALLTPLRKKGGRNNQGKITARHRGGGHKRMYRMIDFRREKDGVPATVHSIQYDPNRSGRIALLYYADGDKRYILAPDGLKAGDRVENGPDAPPTIGNCLPLEANSVGDRDSQYRDVAGPRGALVPQCRDECDPGRPRGRLGTDYAAQWRNSPSSRLVPGDDRQGQQSRSHEHPLGQGGPQAVDGSSSARSRHGHEPDRSSAWWWRRPNQGRSPSGQSDRQVGQGRGHAEEAEAVQHGHRPAALVAAVRSIEAARQVNGENGSP